MQSRPRKQARSELPSDSPTPAMALTAGSSHPRDTSQWLQAQKMADWIREHQRCDMDLNVKWHEYVFKWSLAADPRLAQAWVLRDFLRTHAHSWWSE